MRITVTLLRLVIGGLFFGHGMQKLAGWFGGGGLDQTAQGFESMGISPGRDHAVRAGAAEAGGGALLALGAATPLAATTLISVMTTAIRTVHGPKGPWITEGGYEYNLVLIAALTALASRGPGRPSVDEALGFGPPGPLIGFAALGAGVAGSYLTVPGESDDSAGAETAPVSNDPPATAAAPGERP